MSEASARMKLPFLQPGQAQKEWFHNEALARIDALLHAAVEGAAVVEPPADPEPGQAWLVAAGASGAFAGHDDELACWTEGGWRFVAPVPGMTVWDQASGFARRWAGAAWTNGLLFATGLEVDGVQVVGERQPDIATPSSGTIIDAEARVAIDALIVALRSHGLIG